MWATDYPHPDGFFPGAPRHGAEALKGLSPETQHAGHGRRRDGFYGLN